MAVINSLIFGSLILQIYVNAAPNGVGKLDEIAKVETASENQDHILKEDKNNTSSVENVRQKRFYNPFGYGFPSINSAIYPSFNNRDDFSGAFGIEDPLAQIYRHVQEIAGFVRQPPIPGPPHGPIFYPVVFGPQLGCTCNPSNYQPTDQPTDRPTDQPTGQPTYQPIDQPTDQPTDQPIDQPIDQPNYEPIEKQPINPNTNQTTDGLTEKPGEEVPDVTKRLPTIDDERQNWGLFINRTGENSKRTPNQGRQDFSRPISLEPIRVNRPQSRPSPPIEHGTVQADVPGDQVSPSTENNPQPQRPQNMRPTTRPEVRPPPVNTRPPGFQRPFYSTQRPIYQNRPFPVKPPTACDAAIITCCHQPIVTYECFAVQGCPNITSYGNPCDTNAILRIIERLQAYYANRNG